jgi:uncharacterized protein (DUF952 family)
MRPVYHLTLAETWKSAPGGPFAADSLATEGFIHCSYHEQVLRVANSFLAQAPELVALEIDPTKLTVRLVDEDPGIGELFPHIYGPIDRKAIIDVKPLARDAAGQWAWE